MVKNEFSGGQNNSANQNWIAVIGKKDSLKVPYNDVLYIVQVGKNLRIQKDNDSIRVPGQISKISVVWCEPFFQCHSYLIINLSRVSAMSKGQIFFDNLTSAYLGEKSYFRTRKRFNQYLVRE